MPAATGSSAYASPVIVSMHVATGAAGGAFAGSRLRAALLGLVLHGICDRIPHWDIASPRFEVRSGLALLGALERRRCRFDPAVVGAAACRHPTSSMSCRYRNWAGRSSTRPTVSPAGTEGGVPVGVQLFAAGVIVGLLLRRPKPEPGPALAD